MMPVFSGMINNETTMGRVTSKVQSMSGTFWELGQGNKIIIFVFYLVSVHKQCIVYTKYMKWNDEL